MPSSPVPQAPISDNFLNLICVACEDSHIRDQLAALLDLPAPSRQEVVRHLVLSLRAAAAPEAIVDAIAWLVDDTVAAQAQQVMQALPPRR